MAESGDKYRRVAGSAELAVPTDNKKAAFLAVAEYYVAEVCLQPGAVVSYGPGKRDVGISYLSAVRLCEAALAALGSWPDEVSKAALHARTRPHSH